MPGQAASCTISWGGVVPAPPPTLKPVNEKSLVSGLPPTARLSVSLQDYLGCIIDCGALPLRPEQVSTLFCNIEDIYEFNR